MKKNSHGQLSLKSASCVFLHDHNTCICYDHSTWVHACAMINYDHRKRQHLCKNTILNMIHFTPNKNWSQAWSLAAVTSMVDSYPLILKLTWLASSMTLVSTRTTSAVTDAQRDQMSHQEACKKTPNRMLDPSPLGSFTRWLSSGPTCVRASMFVFG